MSPFPLFSPFWEAGRLPFQQDSLFPVRLEGPLFSRIPSSLGGWKVSFCRIPLFWEAGRPLSAGFPLSWEAGGLLCAEVSLITGCTYGVYRVGIPGGCT